MDGAGAGLAAALGAALPGAAAGPWGALRDLSQDSLLAGLGYAFVLAFARIGTAAVLLPGLGELWVPARVRLAFALALTLAALPGLLAAGPAAGLPPPPPAGTGAALLGIARESLVGLFLGLCVRAAAGAGLVAGAVVALQAGLANAVQPGLVNPDASDMLGIALGLAVIALAAQTGLDHLVLRAVLESYAVIPPPGAGPLPLDELASTAARAVADAFALGLRVAFPVLIASLLFQLGMGLANRFMPQLQAYALAVPVTTAMGLALLALGAPTLLAALTGGIEGTLAALGGAG